MGSEMFVKAQYGKESTKGTPVASTRRWLGTVSIPADRKPAHPPYTLGQRAQSNSTEIRQLLADGIKLEMPEAYFQGLPFIYGITLKGGVTASEQTASQQDYLWDFTPSLTAASSPDAATMQAGDNDQAYAMEYFTGRKISLDFTLGEDAAAKISTDAFARQVSKTTFTSSINPGAVNGISANSAKLWLDSTWANLGTTQKTGLLRGGSVEIDTGNHPKFLGDGNRYFSSVGEGWLGVMGNLVLEGGAGAVSIYDDFAAGTARAIRLSFTGPQIGTGTYHSLVYDMFVAFDEVIPLSGFANGNTLYAVTFSGISDGLSTPHMLGVKVTTNQNSY